MTATGSCQGRQEPLDTDIYTFKTEASAHKFMKKYKGHPWYHIPNGQYEVVKVSEIISKKVTGYKIK